MQKKLQLLFSHIDRVHSYQQISYGQQLRVYPSISSIFKRNFQCFLFPCFCESYSSPYRLRWSRRNLTEQSSQVYHWLLSSLSPNRFQFGQKRLSGTGSTHWGWCCQRRTSNAKGINGNKLDMPAVGVASCLRILVKCAHKKKVEVYTVIESQWNSPESKNYEVFMLSPKPQFLFTNTISEF